LTTYDSAREALIAAYARSETDEFVQASALKTMQPIQNGDSVIFMNYRADRARELTQAFTDPLFNHFNRKNTVILNQFVTLTQYAKTIKTPYAYPPNHLKNTLGEHLQQLNKTQLRLAETEKYAHVTFFFNGGVETPFTGEKRCLIPSPNVKTYDLQPEMNAKKLTDTLIQAIENQEYDMIICNFANPDMVGHTGNFDATIQAIECIDRCFKRILDIINLQKNSLFITADHGNAEKMYNAETKQKHTAHTNGLVPFIYVGKPAKLTTISGCLSDVAPTILALCGYSIPKEMTGKPLLSLI
jgi:2,3-bisphosphoglycerate-independent phosphoglycerate mutase